MTTIEQRVGQLEGAYQHLATKEDVAGLKSELKGDLLNVVIKLAGLQLLGIGAVAAIMHFLGGGGS